MRTVHKFQLNHATNEFPAGKVVMFGLDMRNDLCVWIQRYVDSDATQCLQFFATGQEIPDSMEHVVSCDADGFFFHLYREESA